LDRAAARHGHGRLYRHASAVSQRGGHCPPEGGDRLRQISCVATCERRARRSPPAGFFRAGLVMRKPGRGKRWLLLRRWKTVRGSKRAELQALFAANRRLFKAYVLREQLDRLWTYKTRPGVLNFLLGWFKALRWQRLPEMERLGDFLLKHID